MSKENRREIVLASKSPRRIDLLNSIGLHFLADSDHEFIEIEDEKTPAHELVLKNAEGKAYAVAAKYSNALVIGVDTLGAVHDHVLAKPKDRADAFRMVKLLQENTHEVLTGISIIDTFTEKKLSHIEYTKITFVHMNDEEINKYLDKNEWTDKAAAYAAQGVGSLFIQKIDGDYFNVVGLPLYRLNLMLKHFDIDLLDIVK